MTVGLEKINFRQIFLDIEPVIDGTGNSAPVAPDLDGGTVAATGTIMTAFAGIHRGHEHEIGGKGVGLSNPVDGDDPVFERLAQGIDRLARIPITPIERTTVAIRSVLLS